MNPISRESERRHAMTRAAAPGRRELPDRKTVRRRCFLVGEIFALLVFLLGVVILFQLYLN